MSFSTLHSSRRDRPYALLQIEFTLGGIKYLSCSVGIEDTELPRSCAYIVLAPYSLHEHRKISLV